MNQELEWIASRLAKATRPEEVFGEIKDGSPDSLPALRRIYHSMAKVAHPDVYRIPEEKVLAQTAFSQLVRWFDQAEEKLKSGSYGQPAQVILRVRNREYEIQGSFRADKRFNFYPCCFREDGRTQPAVLRIVRDPRENEISQNEIRVLNLLLNGREASKYSPYIPRPIDEFIYEDGMGSRQAAVFEKYEGWCSLEDVHKAYPRGIDPKDMAWMWRRLLVALGFAHINSVIHGAVLPGNIWIQPEQHGVMLKNWFYAVHHPEVTGEIIPEIDPGFMAWYPQESLNHEIPIFGSDLSMSARCMIHLLGGDAERGTMPDSIPNPLRTFLRGSILPGRRAPQDAWALKHEFDDLLERLWGERRFHPFKMNFPN